MRADAAAACQSFKNGDNNWSSAREQTAPPPQSLCTADLTMSNNNGGRNNVPDLKQASGGADAPGQCFYTRSPTVVMHTARNCGQAAMLVIFNYIH